jgi:hypothetical protein
VYLTFNMTPPTNAKNILGIWLTGIDKKIKDRI